MNLRKMKKSKAREARNAVGAAAPGASGDAHGTSATTTGEARDPDETLDRAEAVNRAATELAEIAEAMYKAAMTRGEAADVRERALAELAAAAEARQKTLAELAAAAEARQKTLAELAAAAEARQKTLAELAGAAEARQKTLAERDEIANSRDRAAAERDGIANARDRTAAERDAIAGSRAAAAPDGAGGELEDAALEKARLEAELQRAHLDTLTGTFRREMGRLALRNEIERARRTNGKFVIAFIDVDGLKGVNDRDGHAAGDRVLRTLAATMRANLRSYDPIVRFGGDEFICGIGSIDADEVQHRIGVIDQSLRQATGVGITAGLASLTSNESLEDLTAKADAALIDAKRSRGD